MKPENSEYMLHFGLLPRNVKLFICIKAFIRHGFFNRGQKKVKFC